MPLDVLCHKPASRDDLQPLFARVLEGGFCKCVSNTAARELFRNLCVNKGDAVALPLVVQNSSVSVDDRLETISARIVYNGLVHDQPLCGGLLPYRFDPLETDPLKLCLRTLRAHYPSTCAILEPDDRA